MNKIPIILILFLVGCFSKKDFTYNEDNVTQTALQTVLESKQFDSLVNNLFEFRGKQLTIIRNELIKTDIPLKMNGKPVKFTNTNFKKTSQFNPLKPVFHAELVNLKLLPEGDIALTIIIYSVGLICDVKVKGSNKRQWTVSYFKWYRT